MPIVINEFEIDVEPQETNAGGGGGAEQPPAPQPAAKVKPQEINAVVRLQQERIERLRAD
jgi:hypothetical protein